VFRERRERQEVVEFGSWVEGLVVQRRNVVQIGVHVLIDNFQFACSAEAVHVGRGSALHSIFVSAGFDLELGKGKELDRS
jgi:hypothetical protein